MSNEGGVNGDRQAGGTITIVKTRVVQRRSDDGKRFDTEGPKTVAGLAKRRDRASTERTMESSVQTKE
jgi:hypothetical protein